MNSFFKKLKQQIAEHPPDLGDGNSILTLLYEAYNQVNNLDDEQIRGDFDALYQAMNGMELREMDKIIYPVCKLCRDHERSGFIEGVKIGIRLRNELA